MVEAPSVFLAFAAGLISFLSPCCLPLVPGYLATVSGTEPAELGRRFDPRVLARAAVFVVRLNRDFRPDALIQRAGKGGPVVAGAAFAIAWTPCVGPTLGAILGLASTQVGTGQGALLLAVYSAGLGLPFLASALAFNAATRSFQFFKRHYAAIQIGSGLVLVAMGVLVLTGELFRLNIEVQQFLDRYGLNFFKSV